MNVESDAEAERVGVPPPRWSVFGAVAGGAHLDELRIELAEDFDQIGLRGHDGVDVLIDTRHFIEAGGKQFAAAPICFTASTSSPSPQWRTSHSSIEETQQRSRGGRQAFPGTLRLPDKAWKQLARAEAATISSSLRAHAHTSSPVRKAVTVETVPLQE